MNWLKRRRPSPALVISLIALFVALGGTGYAALSLPKNSVGTKQLKKNAVTGSKIKKNAVTGSKVKNHSLTGADIKLGALGTVPSASNAGHANVADSATNAGHATTADSAANATGLAGPLASGQTLIGYVDSAGHVGAGEIAPETSISFQIPLAAAPAFHIIPVGGPSTGACPGTANNPSAARGNLCIYESTLVNTSGFSLPDGLNPVSGPTRFGLPGLLGASTNCDYIARGAWAVTGP
jgi:hypothetical protein